MHQQGVGKGNWCGKRKALLVSFTMLKVTFFSVILFGTVGLIGRWNIWADSRLIVAIQPSPHSLSCPHLRARGNSVNVSRFNPFRCSWPWTRALGMCWGICHKSSGCRCHWLALLPVSHSQANLGTPTSASSQQNLPGTKLMLSLGIDWNQ